MCSLIGALDNKMRNRGNINKYWNTVYSCYKIVVIPGISIFLLKLLAFEVSFLKREIWMISIYKLKAFQILYLFAKDWKLINSIHSGSHTQ